MPMPTPFCGAMVVLTFCFRAAGVFALTSRQEPSDSRIAIDLLRKATFKDPRLVWSRILTDSDLSPLHKMEDYKQLIKTLKQLSDGSRAKKQQPVENSSPSQ